MTRTDEFVAWLEAQEGSAYVWGAQGQEIRVDGAVYLGEKRVAQDWRAWVDTREKNPANAARAKAFIEKCFAAGAKSICCYDCSGLIMRYIRDIKGYVSSDMSSRGLCAACDPIARESLSPGDLLFRHNGEKVHHVGVYAGKGMAIESKGRDAGVVINPLDCYGAGYWNRFGVLPWLHPAKGQRQTFFAVCAGGSVNLREGPGKEYRVLAVVHRNELIICLDGGTGGWVNVCAGASGRLVTGWMSEKYIEYIDGGKYE